jgi:hypothetical protein
MCVGGEDLPVFDVLQALSLRAFFFRLVSTLHLQAC